MFRDVDTDAQVDVAKRIVNQYPIYGRTENFLGDLAVMSLAGALGTTVTVSTPDVEVVIAGV